MEAFTIGDVRYEVLPIPGRHAVSLARRFAALAGPGLGEAIGAIFRARADDKPTDDGRVLGSVMGLFQRDDAERLVCDLCAYVVRGGMSLGTVGADGRRELNGDAFDVAFTGRPLEAAEVAARVAEASGFFSHRGVSLRTLAEQVRRAVPELMPKPAAG